MSGILEGILGNSVVQKLAFGQLKGLFVEKNLDFILVRLDQDGEIELAMYEKGEAAVVHRMLADPEPDRVPKSETMKLTGSKKGKKGGK